MMELKLGKYGHYKGKQYEIIGLARHSETLEELVIYKTLYDSEEFGNNALWARPKSMFLETVNIEGKENSSFYIYWIGRAFSELWNFPSGRCTKFQPFGEYNSG